MSLATLLPMAFVMIAGPQILSAVFLATSEDWRRNSIAFMAGAAVSITAVMIVAYLAGDGASSAGGSHKALYVVVLVLLAAAMIHAYVRRHETQPPTWMGRLQTASPGLAFKLGLLLLGVFPTDILTSWAVGTYLSAHDEHWWQGTPFVALTVLILAFPALLLLGFGERAQAFLTDGARMDDDECLDRERDCARLLRRTDHQQPRLIPRS